MALSKVDNLPTLRSTQEADTREVDEPMDPIDPPEPSSSRKRPSWLRGYSMMLKDTLHPEEPSVKVRNLTGIRDT